ncbi:S8 family serine peptidase [haloarchaeon 3A1-DGR]|nr:S8 family serine peptidase [haloarchaeon 3A1-DGR]
MRNGGSGIHIGVVDSVSTPPSSLRTQIDLDTVYDSYTTAEEADVCGHGSNVLHLLSTLAPEATFSTFQVIDEPGDDQTQAHGNRSAVADAIADAGAGDVDMLNLSLGIRHECQGFCSLARETKRVIAEYETTIVSVTGNKQPQADREGVHCPGVVESVISVGGYIPHCSHDLVDSEDSGQWWCPEEDGTVYGPFCGQLDCCDGVSCSEYRREELWDGNVLFHNATPDVIAPALYVAGLEDGVTLNAGTSYSAPIITGIVATILSESDELGGQTPPEAIQTAIRRTSAPIDDDTYYKLDAHSALDYLVESFE